jgi:hypothetical protein
LYVAAEKIELENTVKEKEQHFTPGKSIHTLTYYNGIEDIFDENICVVFISLA